MKIGKPKSKRVPVRLRHKIQKASLSKQRKLRKEAKSDPQWRSRLKKDPGIPNLFPYKAQMLAEIEDGKRRKAEEQMAKRDLAKARRQGAAVTAGVSGPTADLEEEEEDEDDGAVVVHMPLDAEMDVDEQNPMAALLASAQARAQTFNGNDDDDDDEDEDDDEEDEEDGNTASDNIREVSRSGAREKNSSVAQTQPAKKALPKRALEDPTKAVTLLVTRMQKVTDGVQTLLDYYQIPPLVTSGSEFATRYLVEVARKRGRLGRGGIPNLHAAALVVLNDVNDERLSLPSEEIAKPSNAATSLVSIVKTLSTPFRIDGLWGGKQGAAIADQDMVVDG